MIWIYSLTWQEWILGALFLLFGAIYLYKVNTIAIHLKTFPHTRVYLKFVLRGLVLVCGIVALLGPSFGYIRQDQILASKNWLVYVDVSQSMATKDVLPSRLDEAKKVIFSLFDQYPNDLFALYAFAPAVQTLCPLTSDRDAYTLFANQLSTHLFAHPGTNARIVFSDLYNELYLKSKEDTRLQKSSIVMIVTDGEFHTNIPHSTLTSLRKLPYHYIIVGTGGTTPTLVPIEKGFLKDPQGKKVLSSLDRQGLQQLATDLKGVYFDAYEYEKLTKYTSNLPGLDQKKDRTHTSINKYFYFLVLSVLFIAMDIIVTVKTMTI
ncbi:MAG TPA: VWA domain-containing protein [Cytophagaceae bacterium]|jgi:Ca-activated chloride channel family protein|nr:VWA domain-containing protein [Cytophagaceae bacterium]